MGAGSLWGAGKERAGGGRQDTQRDESQEKNEKIHYIEQYFAIGKQLKGGNY